MQLVLKRIIAIQLSVCLAASCVLGCCVLKPRQAHAAVPAIVAAISAASAENGALLASLLGLAGVSVFTASASDDAADVSNCVNIAKTLSNGFSAFLNAPEYVINNSFTNALADASLSTVEGFASADALAALSALVSESAASGTVDCNKLTAEVMVALSAFMDYLGAQHAMASSNGGAGSAYSALFETSGAKVGCDGMTQAFTGIVGMVTLYGAQEAPIPLPITSRPPPLILPRGRSASTWPCSEIWPVPCM